MKNEGPTTQPSRLEREAADRYLALAADARSRVAKALGFQP